MQKKKTLFGKFILVCEDEILNTTSDINSW